MCGDDWFNLLPDSNDQIFNGSLLPFHPRDIHVQIAMIERLFHVFMDDRFEIRKVDKVSGSLVDDATNGDVQFIIMTVPIRMGTFAEYFEILRLIPILIPEFVGSVKTRSAGDGYLFHLRKGDKDTRSPCLTFVP